MQRWQLDSVSADEPYKPEFIPAADRLTEEEAAGFTATAAKVRPREADAMLHRRFRLPSVWWIPFTERISAGTLPD